MESWVRAWREGVAPLLPTKGLEALARALADDDKRLLQSAITDPPPRNCLREWPVEAACAVSFAGWQGNGLATVAEVEEFFAGTCFEADDRLGEVAGCRALLNEWDDTPRGQLAAKFLPEVRRTLAERMLAAEAERLKGQYA